MVIDLDVALKAVCSEGNLCILYIDALVIHLGHPYLQGLEGYFQLQLNFFQSLPDPVR